MKDNIVHVINPEKDEINRLKQELDMKKSIEYESLKTNDNNLNESFDALSDFDYKVDKGITYDVKKSSASCLI